jgi:hypothetical protein
MKNAYQGCLPVCAKRKGCQVGQIIVGHQIDRLRVCIPTECKKAPKKERFHHQLKTSTG